MNVRVCGLTARRCMGGWVHRAAGAGADMPPVVRHHVVIAGVVCGLVLTSAVLAVCATCRHSDDSDCLHRRRADRSIVFAEWRQCVPLLAVCATCRQSNASDCPQRRRVDQSVVFARWRHVCPRSPSAPRASRAAASDDDFASCSPSRRRRHRPPTSSATTLRAIHRHLGTSA